MYSMHGRLSADPRYEELRRIMQACTTKDARFCQNLVQQIDRIVPQHTPVVLVPNAPQPWNSIAGGRAICPDYVLYKERFDTMLLNFCDKPHCYNATLCAGYYAGGLEYGHDSNHDLLKIRSILLPIEIPTLLHHAREGLACFREKGYAVPPDPPDAELPDNQGALLTNDPVGEGSLSQDVTCPEDGPDSTRPIEEQASTGNLREDQLCIPVDRHGDQSQQRRLLMKYTPETPLSVE
ncbi:hypothetical protein BV20DRAFT_979885 [Pilatotrama ljubarskyi]|nr:hypothetical protein BV20DRAFT_979885 [Pilatotrama ljubarskyi]